MMLQWSTVVISLIFFFLQSQEKHEQLVKQSKEEEEIQRQLEKQRQIEQKAQQKYKDWLQKKNQEKIEKEKKEKVMCFFSVCFSFYKDILMLMTKQPDSERDSFLFTGGPYDKSYPSPSFYNPIPWKPIHVPPPETSLNKTSGKKPQKQRKSQQSPSTAFRLRNTVRTAQLLQRR
uniref:Coiled-coil domain containing 34 n=1 Tax=Seriola lalandi dorsalis TaxID=1841481 RepID=A0A3B4X3F3_SERLL